MFLLEAVEYTIVARKDSMLPMNSANRRNYGYIVILKILAELGLDRFLVNRRQRTKIEFNTQAIMGLLVVSRILSPGSKLKAYREKGRYFDFERGDVFKLEDECLPISYEMFESNESEKLHIRPMISERLIRAEIKKNIGDAKKV